MTVAKNMRERVREMTQQGLKPRDISLVLGVTTQNVYYHLARIRAEDKNQKKAAV